MREFYRRFHPAAAASQANAAFCEQVYGRNLYQQGFAEVAHLDHLIEVTGIAPGCQVLDLGCGNGGIAEYISDQTGACVTGIDLIPEAILEAQRRTDGKRGRLDFQVMDIGRLEFPASSFDVLLSVDTLYFSDLQSTLTQMLTTLRPAGCMGIYYSQSCEPWVDLETFPKETVQAHQTGLAKALQRLETPYTTWDYTQADCEHAQRRLPVLARLKSAYEAEGNLFLYESHLGEAQGITRACQNGAHGRYLYRIG
jgi:cyclopropane fatty-acyl-phospholipid synthase-like methyltransferase